MSLRVVDSKRWRWVSGVLVVTATLLALAGCGGAQTRSAESHACAALKPLLDPTTVTPDQTKQAVAAVHGWTSQIIDDDGFKASGQAMYTAFQTSRPTEFSAAVDDLGARCRH